MIDAAAEQAAAEFKQAYLEGFEAGHADGLNEAQRQAREGQDELDALIDASRAEQAHWQERTRTAMERWAAEHESQIARTEPLAVEIAYAVVCKMLGELHAERRLVTALCKELVDGLHSQPLQVRVCESDVPAFDGVAAFDVVGDPSLAPGDCLVRTAHGETDGSVRTQLAALQDALLQALETRSKS